MSLLSCDTQSGAALRTSPLAKPAQRRFHMATQRRQATPPTMANAHGLAGPVSFSYVRRRSVHTTRNNQPRSRTLSTYDGTQSRRLGNRVGTVTDVTDDGELTARQRHPGAWPGPGDGLAAVVGAHSHAYRRRARQLHRGQHRDQAAAAPGRSPPGWRPATGQPMRPGCPGSPRPIRGDTWLWTRRITKTGRAAVRPLVCQGRPVPGSRHQQPGRTTWSAPAGIGNGGGTSC